MTLRHPYSGIMNEQSRNQLAQHYFSEAPLLAGAAVVVERVDGDELSLTAAIEPWMVQQTGVLHAGMVTAFGDHAAAVAATLAGGLEQVPLSVSIHVSLLRGISGERLWVRARPVRLGRRVIAAEAEIGGFRDGEPVLGARLAVTLVPVG